MVIFVKSDKDMPVCLNTETKQKRLARQIAEARLGKPTKAARGPRFQGFFSRTIFVTFRDQSQIVIQFRPEPMDVMPFRAAREALGPVVPEIEIIRNDELEKVGISTYKMTMMPGTVWLSAVAGKKAGVLPTINKSIGGIFARGYLAESSERVIEQRLRPHFDLIIQSELAHIKPFQEKAQELYNQLDKLKILPLWITHFDLNEMNILLDSDFQVSGLVDWELSFPQPFGVFLGRIHTLAGEISEGVFHQGPEFETSERALWDALYTGITAQIPDTVYRAIMDNPETVQLAVEVGTFLDCFCLDEGNLMESGSQVSLRALPTWLTYRIPFLRGNAPPYSE